MGTIRSRRMKVSESRCWFAIESKSFEISIDQAGWRLVGTITKRGRGFVEWIKFGAKSLSQLLEGVEDLCNIAERKKVSKTWLEGGRSFCLALRRNSAGRFLLCSVRSTEGRRFSLVFPEGREMVGGWVLLANKLRSLGIVPPFVSPEVLEMVISSQGLTNSLIRGLSYAEAAKLGRRGVGEKVWLQIGGINSFSKLQDLRDYLVEKWGEGELISLSSLRIWAKAFWRLKGEIHLAFLGDSLILFEFELCSEAERILSEGPYFYRMKRLWLDK